MESPRAAFNTDSFLLALGIGAMTIVGSGSGIAAVVAEKVRGRIEAQVVKLKAEVEERRRAQAEVERNEARLIVHQATIADLMAKDGFRSGSLKEATRHLMRALASGLGIERAGFILLDRDKTSAVGKEIYVVADDRFVEPSGYGDERHLAALKRTSARQVVAVDDTSVENGLDGSGQLFFEKYRIKSVLHAPIIANGDLVGFLTCTNVSHRVAWKVEQRVFALTSQILPPSSSNAISASLWRPSRRRVQNVSLHSRNCSIR